MIALRRRSAAPCNTATPAGRRKLRRDRRGVAAVEFAMVSLVMLMWIFGMMEAARAYWSYQIIQETAIQGARCMGILSSNCATGGAYNATIAKSYIVTLASKLGLTLPATNIIVTRPATCAGTTGFSSVSITYNYKTVMPLMLPSLSSMNLTASSCYYNTQ